jgi:hypothetical protein
MTPKELGFNYDSAGAHTSRSLMTADLATVINYIQDRTAEFEAYNNAIIEENCLGKESLKNRMITTKNLKQLYGLDASFPVWTALRFLYDKDPESLPLLALLCALGRDKLLRASQPFILAKEHGVIVPRSETEQFFDELYPGRFSPVMLKSLAQNINGSYTLTGHFVGRTKKIRSKPKATTASVVYAVYLSTLQGVRGLSLLSSNFIKILELNTGQTIEHLQIASQKGWVNLKYMGEVIEVNFPHFPVTNY